MLTSITHNNNLTIKLFWIPLLNTKTRFNNYVLYFQYLVLKIKIYEF